MADEDIEIIKRMKAIAFSWEMRVARYQTAYEDQHLELPPEIIALERRAKDLRTMIAWTKCQGCIGGKPVFCEACVAKKLKATDHCCCCRDTGEIQVRDDGGEGLCPEYYMVPCPECKGTNKTPVVSDTTEEL
jgi:hypothetical protein